MFQCRQDDCLVQLTRAFHQVVKTGQKFEWQWNRKRPRKERRFRNLEQDLKTEKRELLGNFSLKLDRLECFKEHMYNLLKQGSTKSVTDRQKGRQVTEMWSLGDRKMETNRFFSIFQTWHWFQCFIDLAL